MFEISKDGLPNACIDKSHLKTGSGIVTSINNKTPDENGNVELSSSEAVYEFTGDSLNLGTGSFVFQTNSKYDSEIYQPFAGADWHGIQFAGTSCKDRYQLIFNGGLIAERFNDGNSADFSGTWSEWRPVIRCIATWTSGVNGYRKWSDGFIEQWGRTSASVSGKTTFHTAFSNTNYSIHLTKIGSTDEKFDTAVTAITNTNFSWLWGHDYMSGKWLFWRACGY